MVRKPVFTDDDLDPGLTAGGATRPLNVPETPAETPAATRAQEPAAGHDPAGHQRPPTRIHGYGGGAMTADEAPEAPAAGDTSILPVVGWLVVVAGPGRGAAVQLVTGMNSIGRGADNTAQVDFGDDTISREAHAYVIYDDENREFHVAHAGKTNLVRLNDAPVIENKPMFDGDTIRIGATTMRFVALCGPDFDWSDA